MFATVDAASLAELVLGSPWAAKGKGTETLHAPRAQIGAEFPRAKATTPVALSVAVRRGARYHQKDVALCLPPGNCGSASREAGPGREVETHSQ